MKTISTISGILKWFFVIAIAYYVFLIFFIAGKSSTVEPYLGLHSLLNSIITHVPDPIFAKLSKLQYRSLWWVMVVPRMIVMLIFYKLYKLFHCYQQGEIFSYTSTNQIVHIAILNVFNVISELIQQPLALYILYLHNTHGHIEFVIGDKHIFELLSSGIIFIIALIMREGNRLQEEQRLII